MQALSQLSYSPGTDGNVENLGAVSLLKEPLPRKRLPTNSGGNPPYSSSSRADAELPAAAAGLPLAAPLSAPFSALGSTIFGFFGCRL